MSAQIIPYMPGRMTKDEFRQAREALRETYGDSSRAAVAHRDQTLAALFTRSGWTQEELAREEKTSQPRIAQRLLFGRFLENITSVINIETLAEGRFRSFWQRTDSTEKNERIRFREVERLLSIEGTGPHNTTPKKFGHEIVERFADGKWHQITTIQKHLDKPISDVEAVLAGMCLKGTYNCKAERRRAGTSYQYRILKAGGQKVDLDVLKQELDPILEGLEAEGKKNMATMSPAHVAMLAHRLKAVIEKWAEKNAG